MSATTWARRRGAVFFVLLGLLFAAACSSSPQAEERDTDGPRTAEERQPSRPPGPPLAQLVAPGSADDLASAIESSEGLITGAEFVTLADPSAAAVSDTPYTGLPTAGDDYAVLSTGHAVDIGLPNDSGSLGTELTALEPTRGDTDFDVSVLRLDFTAPADTNCLLGVDFRFLTEEFPEWVGSSFNDAFIIELDESTWTTAGSTISAPRNIAFDPLGSEISVNAAGVTSVNAANALGTTFDGATPLLRAATPLTPGEHSLYLSLFDQGDAVLDSAVLVDNLRIGTVDDPATECVPGALVASPTPMISADPTSGAAPLTVQVDGTGSSDADGSVVSYAWDFGNGETSTDPVASVTYSTPGEYTITLTVTDDEGLTGVAVQTVTVLGEPTSAPTAVISADPTSGAAPLTVQVDGSGSSDADGSVVSYAWDFGNGETSTDPVASVTYSTPGQYTITLTVTDDDGLTGSSTVQVVVADEPGEGDLVEVRVSGALEYQLSGAATEGDVQIRTDALGVDRIRGRVTVTGSHGSPVSVRIEAQRFWFFPVYLGRVVVDDPTADVDLEVPILFRNIAAQGTPTTVSSDARWFVHQGGLSFGAITLEWSVTDRSGPQA